MEDQFRKHGFWDIEYQLPAILPRVRKMRISSLELTEELQLELESRFCACLSQS